VPADADGGRATRGVEYLGIGGDPEPGPPEPSLGPAGTRGMPEGVFAGAAGAGESNVAPSLKSGE